ncbi:MAG: TonB family protein, partial [Bacteroidota bacterium]
LAVVAPQVLRWIAPDATTAVAAVVPVPTVTWLPEVAVGSPAPAVEAVPAAMPVLPVLLGLAVVAAGTLTLVAFASLLRSLVAVRSVRRSLAPAGSEAHDAVADARQRLGIRRAVSVAQAPAGVAPFTVGWRRPLVALPADLSAEALDAAVLHEVAHVRRSDFAWHAAQRAVTAVFAAHPLAWVLGRGLDLDRERAADALVLASGTSPKTYADLLFSYATLPAPPLALGATHGSSALKSRIDAMTHRLSASQSRRLHQLGRLVGLVVLTAVVGGATLMSPTSSALQGENLGDPFAYVERLDVYRANVEPPEAFAYLRDDAPAGTAEAIVEALSDSEGDIRVTLYGPENATSFNSNPEALGPRRLGMGAVRVHSVGTRPVRGPERDMAPAPDLPDGADRTVEGLVLDADSRSPIAGISVAVTGTTVGAATGPDGRYQLNDVPAGDQRLRVSGPGYTMRVVALAADQTSLDIALTTRNAGPSGVVQTSPAGAPRPDVFEVAEVQPELIGGLAALQERVVYPSMAREAGIEGQVVVQFIVDEEGNVTDPVVLRSPADILSQAAL